MLNSEQHLRVGVGFNQKRVALVALHDLEALQELIHLLSHECRSEGRD